MSAPPSTGVLALVPARGGSKGIPRKNLVTVGGVPLVVHSIRHALDARSVTRVVVSTDDDEIAEISRRAGAEVPFLRPAELAGDQVLDLPVFEHALASLAADGFCPQLVVHLRPTAPFRRAGLVDEAVAALRDDPNADSVRSVSPPHAHPYRIFTIDRDGYLDPIMKHIHATPYLLRRQDLPPMFHYNCVVDVTRPATIAAGSMTGRRIRPLFMDSREVIDVDTLHDLEIARARLG